MLNTIQRTRAQFGKRPAATKSATKHPMELLIALSDDKRVAISHGDIVRVREINQQISRLEQLI